MTGLHDEIFAIKSDLFHGIKIGLTETIVRKNII